MKRFCKLCQKRCFGAGRDECFLIYDYEKQAEVCFCPGCAVYVLGSRYVHTERFDSWATVDCDECGQSCGMSDKKVVIEKHVHSAFKGDLLFCTRCFYDLGGRDIF